MNNSIKSHIAGVDDVKIDKYVPFTNTDVELFSVTYKKAVPKQYRIILDVAIDGERLVLSTLTDNGNMIDQWDNEGRVFAVYQIIQENIDTLADFVSHNTPEEDGMYNIH